MLSLVFAYSHNSSCFRFIVFRVVFRLFDVVWRFFDGLFVFVSLLFP